MHPRAIDIKNVGARFIAPLRGKVHRAGAMNRAPADSHPIYHLLSATYAGEQRIPTGTPQWK